MPRIRGGDSLPEDNSAITLYNPAPQGWQKGNSAGGRTRGSRNKYAEDFLDDMHDAWKVYGRPVLMTAALTDPVSFLRVAASLIPRDIEISVTHTSAERLSDDELVRLIEERISSDTAEAA